MTIGRTTQMFIQIELRDIEEIAKDLLKSGFDEMRLIPKLEQIKQAIKIIDFELSYERSV